MKKIRICSIIFLFVAYAQAQGYKKISGYIKDSANNEALIGATIMEIGSQRGAVTNNYGYFSISLPSKKASLSISYVGYSPRVIQLPCKTDTLIKVTLSSSNNLKEVVVYGSSNNRLSSPQTSMEMVSAKTVAALPVIMGESDLTRTLFLLPGVSFGTENTCGYFVRGGNSDQNLLLIDGVPVYNAYHLYGFFSVFNTDAINSAKFYKGGMPARYGGRLSSVLDINMKEGNNQKFSGEVTAGIVSSKFLVEGPLWKGKTSFLITGRRSMMDILPYDIMGTIYQLSGMSKTKRDIGLPDYCFYDLSGKINHTFSEKSRLYFSIYSGKDDYMASNTDFNTSNSINWGNLTTSLRWNYLFDDNLFVNFTVYHSKFQYLAKNEDYSEKTEGQKEYGYRREYSSGIEDYSTKADFDLAYQNHALKFGVQYIGQKIRPGVSSLYQTETQNSYNIDTSYNFNRDAHQAILYVEDNIQLSTKVSFNAGMHITAFFTGIKIYTSLQPRISANYQPITNLAIKASYARMAQNLHLLSNTTLGGPSDIWVPATEKVRPATSDQYVVGVTYKLGTNITIGVEAFKKTMQNLIMYKEGASYIVDKNDWQDRVEIGKGNSHGIEFMLNKETEITTGWVSYTWSKSVRKFNGINLGREFPYTADRTHNIAIAIVQKLGKKFSVGADWVYATGNAVTVANTFIQNDFLGGGVIRTSNSINGFRMPAYHRLDMCFTYRSTAKKFNYALSLGAYNIYNRANPYCLVDSPERLSIQSLFPVLPYLSLSLKFN